MPRRARGVSSADAEAVFAKLRLIWVFITALEGGSLHKVHRAQSVGSGIFQPRTGYYDPGSVKFFTARAILGQFLVVLQNCCLKFGTLPNF